MAPLKHTGTIGQRATALWVVAFFVGLLLNCCTNSAGSAARAIRLGKALYPIAHLPPALPGSDGIELQEIGATQTVYQYYAPAAWQVLRGEALDSLLQADRSLRMLAGGEPATVQALAVDTRTGAFLIVSSMPKVAATRLRDSLILRRNHHRLDSSIWVQGVGRIVVLEEYGTQAGLQRLYPPAEDSLQEQLAWLLPRNYLSMKASMKIVWQVNRKITAR